MFLLQSLKTLRRVPYVKKGGQNPLQPAGAPTCTAADPNQVNAYRRPAPASPFDADPDPDPSFHFDANLQHWPTDLHGFR
jgi:hypothetical protein